MHNHKLIAGKLSRAQCDLLMAHIDGDAWIDAGILASEQSKTRNGLIRLGMIAYRNAWKTTPTHTFITETGRSILCHVLSNYADALIKAGFNLAPARPIVKDLETRMRESIPTLASVLPKTQDHRVAVGPD